MKGTSVKSGASRSVGWGASPSFLLICLLLILATAAVYGQIVGHEFVTYDDRGYITENTHIRDGLTLEGIRWAFTTARENFWHPLTWLSMMLDCQLFGLRPWGHHLSAVLYHAANTLLLFALLHRLTRATWRSALVAAAFALHPLHVESVAWASQRKDLLSTLFWLLATWAYVGYVARGGLLRYAGVAILFVFGLMAKPMLVTLPFTLLLLDVWPLGRLRFSAKIGPSEQRRGRPGGSLGLLILEKLPLLAIAAIFSVIAYQAQQAGGAIVTAAEIPPASRLANALLSYALYIRRMFYPADLAVFYPFLPARAAWSVGLAAAVLVGVSALAIWQARRRGYLLVGWLWYLGTLVPVIGLVKVGGYALADRFTYVPLTGLFIIIAWGLADLAGGRDSRRRVAAVAAAVGLAACAAASWRQAGYWKNTTTLFEHALAVTSQNYVAHTTLGFVLADEGRLDEALEQYQAAVRIAPRYKDARTGLARTLDRMGRYDEATEHLRQILQARGDDAETYRHLGNVMLDAGRLEEALKNYQEALRLSPEDMMARRGIGSALVGLGRYEQALAHLEYVAKAEPDNHRDQFRLGLGYQKLGRYEQAERQYRIGLNLKSEDVPAIRNLGTVLLRRGKLQQALQQFSRAVRLAPDDPQAHYNQAGTLHRLGRHEEALAAYRRAVELKTNYAAALNGLAWILATSPDAALRNGAEAIGYAEKAVALTSAQSPNALDTLAAAYAEAGQFDRAVSTIRKAIEIEGKAATPAAPQKDDLLEELHQRLQAYQRRRAYRKPAKPTHTDDAP